MAELSTEWKTKLQKQENARYIFSCHVNSMVVQYDCGVGDCRLSKYNTSGATMYNTRYSHRPEKALKIWTEDDDIKTTQTTSES